MISVFLREQYRYKQSELISLFEMTEADTITILRKLKEYGILKVIKTTEEEKVLSDLIYRELEPIDFQLADTEHFFVFTFVGVVIVNELVLKCYPKYIKTSKEPFSQLKQVMKVIEKFNNTEQLVTTQNVTSGESTINLLPLMLYLIYDYHENGPYTNILEMLEVNGTGEILWDKSINETFCLISSNKPFYPELYTKKQKNDEFDFFKRLHQCVVTKCSEELSQAGLLELFDLEGLDISDEELNDFGEDDYILDQIQKEISIQFISRKQNILKTIYSYICGESGLSNMDVFSLYGTNSFHVIWEKVCAEVMSNKLHSSLGSLSLPVPLKYNNPDATLISLIEKPMWKKDNVFSMNADKTLIPDTIIIEKSDGDCKFVIFDAKYYNIQLEAGLPLRGQPGIESITKQYLYQLAYQKFLEDHNIVTVRNCFLMPFEGDEVLDKGYVKLEMFEKLGLKNIQIRLLPSSKIYAMYLKTEKLSIDYLNL